MDALHGLESKIQLCFVNIYRNDHGKDYKTKISNKNHNLLGNV